MQTHCFVTVISVQVLKDMCVQVLEDGILENLLLECTVIHSLLHVTVLIICYSLPILFICVFA